MTSHLDRLLVIGTSCCGKTQFSRRLAELLGAPHVELDGLYWGSSWTARPAEEFRELVRASVSGHRWIVDGNYRTVRELIWPRATSVIWLNYGFRTVLGRALSRTTRRSLRAEKLWSGNKESLGRALLTRDSILWWVVSSFGRRRRDYGDLRRSGRFPGIRWFELRKPADADEYLRSLGSTRDSHA